ncbi:MAG: hypothetical protein EBR82_40060 [Caulobacteraceae bacterium]|nr:hypothetical protein [Caulobacteraceae bacterium]
MALKTVIDTLDGIDDAVKPFYTEADGRFVLSLDGVDNHPDVANLRSAYERTKSDREKARQEAASFKTRIADLEKGAPDTAATQAKLAALQEQLQAAEAKANEWQGKYTGVTRDQSLQASLQSVGITEPAFLKAAQAMLSAQVKLGEDGTAYVDTPMGPKVLGDYVKSWAATEGAAFVSPPKGGGSVGGGNGAIQGRTMTRAEFEAKSPAEKHEIMRGGKTKIVD